MADNRVFLHQALALARKTVQKVVFAQAGERRAFKALHLDAQHIHHIKLRKCFVQVRGNRIGSQNVGARGQQRCRSDKGYMGAHAMQRRNKRTAHAGMGDIAYDANLQAFERALFLPDGVQVQKSLGGMLMLAVARIDNRSVGVLRNHVRGARALVAHHEHVDFHGIKRSNGVDKAFALHRRRSAAACVQGITGKALFRKLERTARTGGRLKEQVAYRFATQRRNLLDGALVHFFERARLLQDGHDVFTA